MSHAVDIPITNLDDDDDDFSQETLDPNVLREDFELDDTPLKSSWSVWDKLSQWTQRTYKRVPTDSMATNGIELRPQFREDDSFDLSDDEFTLRRQRNVIVENIYHTAKKYLIILLLVGLLITVIVLSVLLGKKDRPQQHKKPILSNGTHPFYPTTIFISLDGFHPHYISERLTPSLHKLLAQGYGSPYMIPSFPSSTFPNHWTMATGLYPQNHGIVGNRFYDPTLQREFINVIPEKSLDPVFWGGEPIWSTAEHQGVRSAVHMFPGSEVVFPSGNPTEVDKFNGTELLEIKTQRILEWLDRPFEKRPELMIGYVPTIDSLGHRHGIKGREIENGLKYVDSFIHNITTGISDRNATEIVNLVIVSDHGMSPTSNSRLVYLDEILNTTKIQYIDGWPLFGLRPYPEFTVEEIFEELNSSFVQDNGYKIYLRENLPEEWHFGGDPSNVNKEYYGRVAPIWVIPDIGFSITTHDDMERKKGDYTPRGVHGYNNTEVLMRAIFLGTGPYFKDNAPEEGRYMLKPFQNVEVYGILCEMLGLKPAENDGSKKLFSLGNVLPMDWKDEESYPGVKFDLGGILNQESTYDSLFRPKQERLTTTLEGPGEQTTELEEPTPKVEEFSSEKEDYITTQIEEEVTEVITTTDAASTSVDHSTTTTEEAEETKHKSLWQSLEDFGEDLLDDAEDLLDEASDTLEEFGEMIEDAIDDLKDKASGDD
jgi:predicted AlkP superfamily pyrophosphatase or phosphodiesterase